MSRVVTIQRAWRAHRASVVRDLPVLAKSRLPVQERGTDGRLRPLQRPPSSISCDAIADIATNPSPKIDASDSSGSRPAFKKVPLSKPRGVALNSGRDRESIRLQLAMEENDDDG